MKNKKKSAAQEKLREKETKVAPLVSWNV